MKPTPTTPQIPLDQLPLHGRCRRRLPGDDICGGAVNRPDGTWGLLCYGCGWYEEIQTIRARQSAPRKAMHAMEQLDKPEADRTVFTLEWACLICSMPAVIVPGEDGRSILCMVCPCEFFEATEGKPVMVKGPN